MGPQKLTECLLFSIFSLNPSGCSETLLGEVTKKIFLSRPRKNTGGSGTKGMQLYLFFSPLSPLRN